MIRLFCFFERYKLGKYFIDHMLSFQENATIKNSFKCVRI